MKKSMIAAAVVAAAFAASANAGFFNVTGASYSDPGVRTIMGAGFSGGATSMATGSYLLDTTSPQGGSGPNTVTALTTGSATSSEDIMAASLGSTTAGVVTVQYFTFEDSSGLGYFGLRIANNSANNFLFEIEARTQNPANSFGSLGILTTGGNGSVSGSGLYTSNAAAIGATQSFFMVMGGVPDGRTFEVDVYRALNETGTFNIEYLSWNGSSWTTLGTGSNAQSSSLSFAAYSIPVPAPALLAGAGLVGAAALRRRMAKKA